MADIITPGSWRPSPEVRARKLAERAVNELLKTVMMDRSLLLKIVADGKADWKKYARKAFKGFAVSDEAILELWRVFALEAGADPKKQLDQLLAAGYVRLKMDRIRGLCQMITSERHMDEILEKIDKPEERAAIRATMVPILRQMGVMAPEPS